MHAGPLGLANLFPIDHGRRGLHQNPGLVQDGARDVVLETRAERDAVIARFAPTGIGIVASKIQHPRKAERIQPVKRAHQVRGHGQIAERAHRLHLMAHKIYGLVGDKAHPIEIQAMDATLPARGRRMQLAPVRIRLGPEPRPIRLVERVQRAVFLHQPAAERLLAQLAMAFTRILVGNVPAHHRRMLAETLCERGVDLVYKRAVYRRSEAMVVPLAVQVANALVAHAQHFGIFLAHPRGPRAAGRGEKDMNAIGVERIQHALQPIEIVFPFPGFERGPGKNAHAHQVAMRQLHQAHVFFQRTGNVPPLIRIVVPAMGEKRQTQLWHIHALLFNWVACSLPHSRRSPSYREPARRK